MAVEVRITLTEKQHEAFKKLLKQQCKSAGFEQQRAAVIIRSNPAIAAARKALAALQNTLETSSL